MLNTRDALELHRLLKNYVPEDIPETMFEFTSQLIMNIRNSDNQENFGRALILMSGKGVLELDKIETSERIELFVDGLRENYFLNLLEFCKIVGL